MARRARRVTTRLACALIVLAWTGFALATQRWLPWGDEIRLRFASDVRSYESIARAAPGLPDPHSIPLQHAQRFAGPWVVGTLADAAHVGLHPLYRIVSIALLAATVAVVARTLLLLDVPTPAFAVAIGLL